MSSSWEVWVAGRPVPKGSYDIVPHGRPMIGPGGDRYYRVRDMALKPVNEGLTAWTNAIKWACGGDDCPPHPLTGPWRLELRCYFKPPKKPAHPDYPLSRSAGDGDKLLRAVCDALTGVYWPDDSYIVSKLVEKHYGMDDGAQIRVWFLGVEQILLDV